MRLPKRIQADVAALQHESELLVALVQLGVLALLMLFYVVSPAGYAPDAPVHSASLGLGLFTILVLGRLWFAYTRQLTPLFLGFSVIAEMAVLMFTIWTYHLQFEAMPTVDLKNTHITYVFVLIALRALRFEPIWVILSGLAAAIGWTMIVGYTLLKAGREIITWDYVTYVSTRSLYLGAEFDKILAILLVTAITAYMLKRARETLFIAVSQLQATKDLSKFFDSDVAKKITDSEESLIAGYGEIRKAAILFIDMRGFTKASAQLSPTGLIALLAEYQKLLIPIVRKHHGHIDKFIGDGILVSFGAASPSDSYAADAMRTVDDILLAADRWGQQRQAEGHFPVVGIGASVAAGEVIFGVIGYEDRLEYTLISETVNLAAKLEKHNKIEGTRAISTKETLELAIAQGYVALSPKEIRLKRNVAGISELIDVAVLA